ncbi:poly(3-hydroxyalkanoate) depolymerase [Marinobacter sp. SS21]|uniref:poly(3-hydroxyalkanoate) depolymerase n=1 Tax=Marinobacter sp. SS21 TaxID=2979460 RepID=UPI00232FA562|nr:poly(3-hydroxyalkanoate) depolymerase [Marinobacter sp. SS21]MDC0662688.1 poly(3-hydroxyalkanoate) depolymerase [Marinobacter sp. SS21]
MDKLLSVGKQAVKVKVRPGRSDSHHVLLIVNGVGANLELLDPLVEALDERLEVVRFDVPGVGGSPARLFPYRLPSLARLVVRLLDELGYDRVTVMGISWGGTLAQQLAHLSADRVNGLILAATSMGMVMIPGSPKVLLKMAHPKRYISASYMHEVGPTIYGGKLRHRPDRLKKHFSRVRWQGGVGYLHQLLAVMGWTSALWLHKLPQPTLVLAGDDDPIVPVANARLLAWRIPKARLRIIRGGGHMFPLDDLPEVSREISRFILPDSRRMGSQGTSCTEGHCR